MQVGTQSDQSSEILMIDVSPPRDNEVSRDVTIISAYPGEKFNNWDSEDLLRACKFQNPHIWYLGQLIKRMPILTENDFETEFNY